MRLQLLGLILMTTVLLLAAWSKAQDTAPPVYTVVHAQRGADVDFRCLSSGELITNPIEGAHVVAQQQQQQQQQKQQQQPGEANFTMAGFVPTVMLNSHAWMYATGKKPAVGTRYVSAGATSTTLVVHSTPTRDRIYYLRGPEGTKVPTYVTFGKALTTPTAPQFSLSVGEYVQATISGTFPNVTITYSVGTFNPNDFTQNVAEIRAVLEESDAVRRNFGLAD